MKLYGIRPKKAKNKKQTNKGKKQIQINKIFDFTFFKVLCLWASQRAQGILYKA